MDDLLFHIYRYVLEHLEPEDLEYEDNLRYAAAQYRALAGSLSPRQAEQLRDYQGMSGLAAAAREEAVFRAAFQAGLALGTWTRARQG